MAWTLKDGPGLLTGHINRWVTIGGFRFQPVEPAKLAAIAVMAETAHQPAAACPALRGRQVLAALGFGFVPLAVMLVLQPNFGNVLVITGVTW